MDRKPFSIRDICHIAVFTGLIAVLAQVSIPLPGGVPVTMQTLGVLLAGIVLGARKGAAAALCYLLVGAVGLPVFAGFSGGLSRLVGPAGGFLLSYPLMAWLTGHFASGAKRGQLASGLLISTAVCYIMGSLMYAAVTGLGFKAAIAACVLPFLAGDILKMVLAAWFGTKLKKALARAEV
jgi:biotin transport system substrate-specific component